MRKLCLLHCQTKCEYTRTFLLLLFHRIIWHIWCLNFLCMANNTEIANQENNMSSYFVAWHSICGGLAGCFQCVSDLSINFEWLIISPATRLEASVECGPDHSSRPSQTEDHPHTPIPWHNYTVTINYWRLRAL